MNSTLNTGAEKLLERQNVSKFWLVNSFLENFTCENTSGATFIQVSEYRHVTWYEHLRFRFLRNTYVH